MTEETGVKEEKFGRRNALRALVAGALAAKFGTLHAQQGFPNRVLKIFMGVPPGGSADLAMRPLANQLGQRLGQQVLLEHRPGANQSIAANAMVRSPADGYSLLMASDAAMSVALALKTPLPYNVKEDFVPVGLVTYLTPILVTNPNNPINTVADLVARAKAAPGKISYGSLGVGSTSHIGMEAFAVQHGIQLLHVPYAGTAPATTAAIAGEVDVVLVSIGNTLPYIPARLKPIAVAGVERSPRLPNVPTFVESGFKDFVMRGWLALFAPRGTPAPVLERLRKEIWEIVSAKGYIDSAVLPYASDPSTVPPDQLENFLRADQEKWVNWVRQAETRGKVS